MASETNGREPQAGAARYPLLGGGERLREDVARSSGGGNFTPPYTPDEMYEVLAPQATRLLDAARLYPVGTREARAVKKTKRTTTPNALTKTILLAGEPDRVRAFASMVLERPRRENDPTWKELSEFSTLELPDPDRVLRAMPEESGDGELVTWEAVLNPVGRSVSEQRVLGDEAFERWVEHVRRLRGDVDVEYRRRVGDLTFVPVALTVKSVRAAAAFNLLRAIRPMPKVRPVPATLFRVAAQAAAIPPATGTTPRSAQRVAVFDGGVDAAAPPFRGFVNAVDLTPEAAHPDAVTHGSVVTAAVLYGYVEPGAALPAPVAYVDHFRVVPAPSSADFDEGLYWILDRIKETLRTGAYSLVNLSLGPDCAVEDEHEPHRWTAELDELAAEFGLTIVSAAGNNGGLAADFGFDRVQPPADMANGIGVGACPSRAPAARVSRAPYSARGPGRAGQRVSPAGLAFGGLLPDEPYVGVGMGGRWVETQGTSFASPLVAHSLAELGGMLGDERARPQTLRAFAAHFATRRERGHKPFDVGHGRLRESYADVWDCASNAVTVVYDDVLERGEPAAMYLPLPAGMAADAQVRLDWTLCYVSDVDTSDAVDYTRSGFEITFRPHFRRRRVSDAETHKSITVIDIETEYERFAALVRARGVTLSETPVSDSSWRQGRDEGRQRGAGKWETLTRGRRTLSAGDMYRPRLDLNHLSRSAGILQSNAISALPVTLIVTLTAPTSVALYEMVRAQYGTLTPLQQQLGVTTTVAV